MKVFFTVFGEPGSKGRPRFSVRNSKNGNFVSVRTPERTVIYENLVKTEYLNQTDRFRFGDNDMLKLDIAAYYKIPESKSKKTKINMVSGIIRPVKKPDVDNVVKIIADSLNEIAYHDDKQIVECSIRKFYSDVPRVEVEIERIENNE